jgi:hypothetical protein
MKNRYPFIVAIAVISIFCMTTFMASMVEARGGRGGRGGGGSRGGGGFSRSSPAAGGGFSSRKATRQPTRQAKPRQETRREQPRDSGDRDDAREDRQQHRDDAREDRQDFIDDEWDDHNHHGGAAFAAGVAVGAAASSNYVTDVPCSTTVIVNNVTYYNCDSIWYSRGSQGGEVVYIITSAPAGY